MGHLLRKLLPRPGSKFITAYTAIFMFHLPVKPGVTTAIRGLKALEPQAPSTRDAIPPVKSSVLQTVIKVDSFHIEMKL
ncbi:hypothetical protein BOTNAR_0107g00190 [Botryotinia narcissicola]|uniref:Uncharacterized protein n=1 Tax=Botryotinia narcissicola TaxID=278944 RepID=A0A4Z1INJ7_9HELO|nr:hypothetical protein BOTNAR_0107g00190 [Botryotinia narcissicola]